MKGKSSYKFNMALFVLSRPNPASWQTTMANYYSQSVGQDNLICDMRHARLLQGYIVLCIICIYHSGLIIEEKISGLSYQLV